MQTHFKKKPNFQFYNQVSPRYIETLFLPLNFGEWYSTHDLKNVLYKSGLDVEGKDIVSRNVEAWTLSGIGDSFVERSKGRMTYFRLSEYGKYIQEMYSTNRELFFDLIHFTFYSAWVRSNDVWRGRFWLYATICDDLWDYAPAEMDSIELASKMQSESQRLFSEYQPTFPERSVRSIFPWLGALTPPFLQKCGQRSLLCSKRRAYCTPQLFHLATDLAYTSRQLLYGTSLAVDDTIIQAICKTCLLDPDKFWDMADRTQMSIRGFEIRKGQFGTSISLEGPPGWIDLPHLKPYQPGDNDLEGDE
jgi:hypothetical protein